jgi:hypothetical protein
MKPEYWIETLVGAVILGALAFLAIKVVDMSGTLGSVDARASSTAERVNRIAAALPDVGVRVASEEVSRPIQTAVLSTKPSQAADGSWYVTVSVLDTQSSKKWTLPVHIESKDDREIMHTLVGAGAEAEPGFSSLSRLQEYSRFAHGDSSIPPYVDEKTSFVLYSTNGEEFVTKFVSTVVKGAQETPLDIKVDDYATLVKALKQREEAFKTPKK